ncbi:MAG TPA: thiol reductant ABC exporter subunit CydD [Gordonia sp. (in: high G+C Gram-positive bacteria)]|uniref:thiol reductant ABC exporter subunit CydD n=1 Tax=unclassified Gordonia (in: high G+C Gram-positive bacteria) TaxID=2657482 RepID=UPI000FBD069B|nr:MULTISPECIES: thiol reductant ABC exporter subunit CydD [unclassified Gordonia (in: high G+C Gram-positive bacteria)]RUP41714.1 MAG: thiol reductant ABC exporter subunit CydD [Gordonia sp. (in: high G+C Gram-positive bacteria)]HNP57852.1 thiol reductant ABC exporter subunit CydD [Gordonia sp. (in: high G+C Gram-positive bacteria)]HRC51432.1 thiol reductant ABC exporter subunit CydD [Gordonia sp. (in: high G+C Gram-positive bacteria)]
MSAGPLDPRLLRRSPAARRYIGVTVLAGLVTTLAVIAVAFAVASILAELVAEPLRCSFDAQTPHLLLLVGAVIVQTLTVYAGQRYAQRAAQTVIGQVRDDVLGALTDPARTDMRSLVARRSRASTVLLAGLDDLGPYLSAYVPSLILAVTLTPIVIVVIAAVDLVSAGLIVLTIPLIPIFGILIGLMTRDRTQAKLDATARQQSMLLDLIAGIPTLRALHRAQGAAAQVKDLGSSWRRSTMGTLRVAFLSGAWLELMATLSVALVAVSIGLRLVYGEMSLFAGVLALILAPEAYRPLRQVGAAFHDSADGVAATDEAFALVDADADADAAVVECSRGTNGCIETPPNLAGATIRFAGIGVRSRDGWAPRDLRADCAPGAVTVLTGPNGSGKSTALAALLGLVGLDEGAIIVDNTVLSQADRAACQSQIAWLPQHPAMVPGTVAENLALYGPLDPDALASAAAAAGWDGAGHSAGQRQRLALTRTLARDVPVVLLDEPTAHLDEASRVRVIAAVVARARAGATVIVAAHRTEWLDAADRIIDLARETAR